jgi:hypothetical protein
VYIHWGEADHRTFAGSWLRMMDLTTSRNGKGEFHVGALSSFFIIVSYTKVLEARLAVAEKLLQQVGNPFLHSV